MSWDRVIRLAWLTGTGVLLLTAMFEAFTFADHRDVLVCDQPSYQFGPVESREKIVHNFLVKNNSNRPIEITAAPGCSACIEVDMDRRLLAAHEAADVRCELDLRRFKGKVHKNILVQCVGCENATDSELVLVMAGQVVPSIVTTPSEILLKQAEIAPEQIVEIRLEAHRPDEQFKVLEITSATENWVAEGSTSPNSSTRQSFRLRCVKPSRCSSYVKIKTDAEWFPEVIVPIRIL